ncbi:MAG: glycosyltransferase family 87 protein [Terracidiphilus sp.]
MNNRHRVSMWFLLASIGVSVGLGIPVGRSIPGGSVDLQVVYYGAKCAVQGCDPYKPSDLRKIYATEEARLPFGSIEKPERIAPNNYLPPTFLVIAPLTLLPWSAASALWLTILLASFFGAGFLLVKDGAADAPRLSLLLGCVVLANTELGIALANTGVLVVSLCAIAVHCLLRHRFVGLGQGALVCALVLKPHDAFLLLIYFLIATRGRCMPAWKIVGVTVAITAVSLAWIARVSPHWLEEWQSNIATLTARGGLNDPGPTGEKSHGPGQVIDLQSAISVVRDEPRFYDSVSYGICGALLLVWGAVSVRNRFSTSGAWLSIAAVVPLTLLITYHRPYDAKLLLLSIPACARLWREGGARGRAAAAVTTAAIIFTADIPLLVLSHVTTGFDLSEMALWQRIWIVPIVHPAPITLLLMALFYLWVYARAEAPQIDAARETPPGSARTAAAGV